MADNTPMGAYELAGEAAALLGIPPLRGAPTP